MSSQAEWQAEIDAQLMGEGAPFETQVETVLGVPQEVFKTRAGSLRELLERTAAHGDSEHLVFGERRQSFDGLRREVASTARALQELHGVGPGDRVAILAANRPEWLVTWWACVSLGAVAVGLNGWWAGDEIAYGLSDCDPKLLVGDRRRLARIDRDAIDVPVVEMESGFAKLAGHAPDADLPDTPIAEDDPACILYTSGTTGRPKGAVNTHRGIVALVMMNFLNGARRMLLAVKQGVAGGGPSYSPSALVTTPFFHVSGLYAGAIMMLASGAKVVLREGRFDPVDTMELIERERITIWGPMGTMAYRVVNHPDVSRYDLSSLANVGSGGAPVSPELQERMREVFSGARRSVGLGYGLTECTALATVIFGEELERHPDSVGGPLPTVSLEIRDESDRALSEGAEGEIHIKSPLVMREYWRNPEATAKTIKPGRWLATGDVGRIEDGRLYVNARARDLILRGAENIYPAEIELRLEAHPDVAEAAVYGVDHEELGQEVKAVVVPEPGAEPASPALGAFVREALAAFKVPAHWEIRREPLPRNATGKVLKNVLRGDAENAFVEE